MDRVPLIAFKPYDAYKEIAATAPAHWGRSEAPKAGHSYCVMFCDEADVRHLRKPGVRRKMEKEIGCPLIPVLGDSVRQKPSIVAMMGGPPVITLDVPVEGGTWSYWPSYPAPFVPRPFDQRSGVVFGGRTDYPDRQKLINALERVGVQVIRRDSETRTYQDYANDLCRAKAVVNLCSDRKTGKPQTKARVVEACLAGALLLEQANPLTRKWLTPGNEYLEWNSLEELQAQIKKLDVDLNWCGIAERGWQAAIQRLTPNAFWNMVEKLAA